MFRIDYLYDAREALPELIGWYESEWEPYYGEDGPGDAAADLEDACRKNALPLALLARTEEGLVAGVGALRKESVPSHRHLSPWITGLLVARPFRAYGVASALVARLEDEARRLGFPQLHVATDAAAGIVERRGWKAIDRAPTLREETSIYVLDL